MGKFITKNVKLVCTAIIAIFIVLIGVSVHYVQQIKTSYNLRQFLPQNHPLIYSDTKVKERFQQKDSFNFLLVLTIPKRQKGDWLNPSRLAQLQKLEEKFAKLKGVQSTLSIASVQGAANSKDGLAVGRLVELTPPSEIRKRVLSDRLLTPGLITKDAKTAVMSVDVAPTSSERLYQLQDYFRMEAQKALPGHNVRIGGIPALQGELSFLLQKELSFFLVIALLLNALILFLTFSSWTGLVVPLIVIATANLLSLGAQVAMGYPFTVLLTTLPILVSLTVLSMATQSILRFNEDVRDFALKGLSRAELVWLSTKKVAMPNFLTALTAAIGFIVSAFTDVPLLNQYGIVIAAAMVTCWMTVGIFMPVLLFLLPMPIAREWTQKPAVWAFKVLKYPKATLATVGSLTLVMLIMGSQLNWAPRLFDDLPQKYEARSTMDYIDKSLGGTIPLYVEIQMNEAEAWSEPKTLIRLQSLMREWENFRIVGSVAGLPDFLKVMFDSNSQKQKTRQMVAETLFLYSLSPENPTRGVLTADGRATLVHLRVRDVPADQIEWLINRLQRDVKKNFPKAKVRVAGMASNAHPLSNELSKNLIYGFWPSLFAITAMLLLIFRSFFWTLMALLPNLVPPALLLGVLGVMQTPIKPSLAVVFSVALGLAFNNTVFLLERLIQLRKTDHLPIRRTFYLESNLCLASTLVVMSGFTIFLLSYFDVNKQFGFYILLSLAFGLLGDLLLLPACLVLAEQWRRRRKIQHKPTLIPLPHEEEEMTSSQPNKTAIAASVLLFALFMLSGSKTFANRGQVPSAGDLLSRIEKQITSKSESAVLTMKIIEADGSLKSRKIEVKRMNGDKSYARVRLLSPADLKGTALLSVYEKGSEDQWLYLPSSKQTRRIISSGKQSSFLGSELNFEDFSASSVKNVKSRILGSAKLDGEKCVLVESVMPDKGTSYSKVKTWISEKKNLPLKAEYFDHKGQLLKVIMFENYKQFGGKVWRAQKMTVRNVQNKRATELVLSDLRVNTALDEDEFSLSALKGD